MPMMPPPGMGSGNPQNIEALAAAGDPRAQAMLQQMQAAQGGGQPGMPPQGGMPPPGAGGPPQQGMPMSQAEFSGYGKPRNPDEEARRAALLIEALRNRR